MIKASGVTTAVSRRLRRNESPHTSLSQRARYQRSEKPRGGQERKSAELTDASTTAAGGPSRNTQTATLRTFAAVAPVRRRRIRRRCPSPHAGGGPPPRSRAT